MAELVDALDLGSSALGCGGSTPPSRTRFYNQLHKRKGKKTMEVMVEEVSVLTRKVTITLPESDVQKKLKKAYDKLQKESKMKGFRRGKVPRSIIVKNYKSQVEAEVGETLVQETYFDIIEKQDFDPVVHPEIDVPKYNDDGTFTYVAKVDIKPEFELANYKGLEIEKTDVSVTEEEISQELEAIRKGMAPLRNAGEKEIGEGDIAIVDFQGFHNGNPMKEVNNKDYTVDVGEGKMGPEFEAKLVGMKAGEKATHEVEFPEKHPNPILEGKKIDFLIEVKEVKERVLPEFDDEFAKDVGEEYSNLEELKSAVTERIENDKKESVEGDLNDKIMQALLKDNEFEVPKRLIIFEVEQMIKQTEQQLQQAGMSLEAAGLSREAMTETNEPLAIQRVRGDFMLKKVAELEEIKVNDEDLDRGFKRIGDQYNMSVSKVKEYFQSRDDLLPFMNELLNEKVLHFLRDEAKLVDAKPEEIEETVEDTKES